MSKFQVAYVPIGVPTFHLESAQEEFEKSIDLLKTLTEAAEVPEKMLLSIQDLNSFLDTINPSLIVLQNITFANAAYASEVLKRFECPVLLWTLREPVIDGGRLRLNSLTGAYSAGNAMANFRDGNFEYIFGSPKESRVREKIRACISAAYLKQELKSLKIASVGHTPQGFGFGRALDIDMLNVFGATLESIEARELIDMAKEYSDEECELYLAQMMSCTVGLDKTPDKNQKDFSRLCKAYREYVEKNGIGALSSRCWPDFFTAFGTPVCGVLAMLNDIGVAASCEADTYGALSMFMGMKLTKLPVFFGDPVSLDETENTITFWHCGMAPCSIAREDTGAVIGVHPNRKIGPVMDFGCRAADKVTVFRVGRKKDGSFRFFLTTGKALDKPKQFLGASVVVQTESSSYDIVNRSVKDGWEPHFVIIYGDVKEELKVLGHMLDLEICEY